MAAVTVLLAGVAVPAPAAAERSSESPSLWIAGAPPRVEARNGTVTPRPTGTRTRAQLVRAGRGDGLETAHALAEATLVAHGMPPDLPETSAGAAASPGFFALPGGDLNDDGTNDAIGLVPPGPDLLAMGTGDLVPMGTVAGLSGVDGSTLWTSTAPAHLVWAYPGRFGPAATPGVLFQTYRFIGDLQHATLLRVEMRLIALAGDGETLWERTLVGHLSEVVRYEPQLVEFPFLQGTLDATPSGATDLLVDHLSLAGAVLRYEVRDRALVLDGADGATVSEHEHGGTNVFPVPVPASDYSGDGLDDYLFLDHEGGAASAVGGATGQDLWRSEASDPTDWQTWTEIGDANGDAVVDIAAWEPPNVAVLSGDDGSLLWRRPSQWPREIGDVDGDGLADVGVQEFGTSVDAWSLTSRALSGLTGSELSVGRHAIDLPGDEWRNGGASAVWMPNVGDVDEDGTTDVAHSLDVTLHDDDDNVVYHREDGGVVSGRNGDKLWEGVLWDVYSLHATLDGRGTDLLRAAFTEDGTAMTLEGMDGRGGDTLWAQDLDLDFAWFPPWLYVQDFDGDAKADLLITTVNADGSGFVARLLDGATGIRRW